MTTIIRKETLALQEMILELLKDTVQLHRLAQKSTTEKSKKIALQILQADRKIDLKYNYILENCSFILTKRPLALELRRVLGYLQIGKDIERIADCAVKIAKFVIANNEEITSSSQRRILVMHNAFFNSLLKLRSVLQTEDTSKALKLATKDDELDGLAVDILKQIIKSITHKNALAHVDQRIFVLKTIYSLERAGDHIVNICEAILYIQTGHLPGLD